MSAKTSTSPGIDARSDSVRRGGCAAGENSSCDRSSKGGKAQIEGNGKQAAVYGPELPPSMARSKVDDAAAGGIAGLSGTSNFIDIAKLLREESRNDDSKSVYMRRTESELQSLFYSHLTSIMDRHGYKDKHFREQDVARVMVDAGLMSSLSDDPALALASDLKTKMIGIVHKNLRQMASSVMVPEFFEDMAVDPMVIDTLVDMSRQGSSGSKQAASVVAFAAAAAIAEADADFEDALKTLDTMTLVESFHLDELCRNQRNPASAMWRSDSTDTEPRPPSEPHFTLSPASVPASVASSEPASAPALATETALLSSPASASKSASKSSLAETKKLMAQIRSAAKGTQINSASASSLKELAAKTEELRAKDTQVLENKDPVATVAAHIASIASVSNPAPNGSAAPPKAQSRKSRRKVKAKEREMAAAANGKAKAGLPAQSETQQSRVAASKPAPRPASSSQQRLADLNSALSPLESLCKTFLSSSTSDSGSINDYLEQLRKQSNRLDKLWSSDSADEHQQVRAFWIGLSDIERQALIFVEKEVVLARVRDHQNFSCNCNVCTRKREAIEHELDCLYECYYEELQEKVRQERMRVIIRKMEPMAKANILSSIGAVVDTAMSSLPANARPWSKEDLKNTITKSIKRAKLTSSLSHPDNREPADIGTFLMRAMTASVLDNLSAGDAVAKEKNESNRDAAIKGAVQTILDWAKGTLEPPRDSGDDLDPSDAESEILNNNDIFYTEHMLDTIDTFPTDSKKFFDMMERLAEFRMRREDAMLDEFNDDHDSVSANVVSSSAKSSHKDGESMTHSWVRRARDSARRQAHCPDCHGEISEPEDHAGGVSSMQRGAPSGSVDVFRDPTDLAAQSLLDSELCYATDSDFDDADGNDDVRGGRVGNPKGDEGAGCYSSGSEDQDCEETDEEDDDDDDEDDLCDTDDDDLDDLDDLDSEYAEREAEEGRKVFQLFAARLFEQRVINAYREKIARERQQNLIKELEEEEKEQQAKERRKQKKREREKERKKQFQLKKEQERLAKEAALKAEQERKREAEQKRYEEMMQKRREQELKAKKALEERNRRILEEADRRMEKERQQKQRAEQEQLEKEREQMRKAREAESLQQQQQQQKQHKQTPKQRHKDRALAKGNELTQAKSAPMSPNVAATAATTAAAAPAPVPAVSAYPSSPKPAPRFSASEAAKSVPAATEPSPLNSIAPGSSPSISALGQMSVAAQHSLITSVSVPAGIPNGILAEPAFLASSIGANVLQSPSPSPRSPMASRPSLPLIHPFGLGSASPTAPSFGMPGRMRANSGSNIYHALHPASTPVQAPTVAHAVSPEIDAEISSIVGRVMGSSSLQDDLISGAEWRTEPVEAFTPDRGFLSVSATSAVAGIGAPFGLGNPADVSFAEVSARRNSMPHNQAVGNIGALGSVETPIAASGRAAGARFHVPLEMAREIESIFAAYCALERFRCDARAGSAGVLGSEAFGGFHSVAELAKMHGRMNEPDIWAICSASAQSNPGFCRVSHATHMVAFARTGSSNGGLGMSSSTPRAMESAVPTSDCVGSSTPLGHLAVIAEDMMSAFSLQPQVGGGSSPLLAKSFPLGMSSSSYAQSRSPLIPSSQPQPQLQPHSQAHSRSQSQSQSQSQSHLLASQLGALRVPIMAAPMAMPGSAQQQQQISPSMPMSHAGLGFSPSIHQGPSLQMFFNAMPLHTPPAASSLVASPFQQQMPSSSWSPSKPRLTGAATGIGVGGDMILPSASLGSVPAQLRQAHMFQSSAQQQYPHQ